ncbi:P-loop containing nucleoside triphosphate hydrolase protein [Tricladium varicosporioides]|nr:P-loop containing nucleoside triphosphate hydrolase protein [Hymenoscyphus varicosporioides]
MPPGPAGGQLSLGLAKVQDRNLSTLYIFNNLSAVSTQDFPPGRDVKLVLNNCFVVRARPTNDFPAGCISLSDPQRTWMQVSLMDRITAAPYRPHPETPYLEAVEIEADFMSKQKITDKPFSQDILKSIYVKQQNGDQEMQVGKPLLHDSGNVPIKFTVSRMRTYLLSGEVDSWKKGPESWVCNATEQTKYYFKSAKESRMIVDPAEDEMDSNPILSSDFNFANMGIGGLDSEFTTIFRRAFASRIFPAPLIKKMGIEHVKGLLLYGPPGTGKTLIARQIGKFLNCREPKIINGPEVLNKFVGQSEENIRKLFADAEKEEKEKGDKSGLHIIIFDELDAVCKQRGSGGGGGTGVGDSVVNQLLSKLDGVNKLNNLLLIGMTNRKDMIDDALLRPGRLEVHVEISLPDHAGRIQILNIHMAELRKNGMLNPGVEVEELAALTKNCSGSELAGLVRGASTHAITRHTKIDGASITFDNAKGIKVTREDFLEAIPEYKPKFGVSEDRLNEAMIGGIFNFSTHVEQVLEESIMTSQTVKKAKGTSALDNILLYGPKGSGTSALAAKIAKDSGAPFIKMVTASDLRAESERASAQKLIKVFEDAYKSRYSCVVLDCIERLVEWADVGMRYSSTIFHEIVTSLTNRPPSGHGLLIIATSSRPDVMRQLNLLIEFNTTHIIPNITRRPELEQALIETRLFRSQNEIQSCLQKLDQITGGEISLTIKKVILAVEQVRDERGDITMLLAESLAQKMR